MKILLLGGYGAVGYEIVVAGRSLEEAQSAAATLSKVTNNTRVSGKSIDAFNYTQVVSEFETVDWVIICIPLAGLGGKLAQAAYEAGVHYLDINANQEKQAYLQSIAADIKQKGLHFVSEAGFGPGVPSLLVLYAYDKLGKLNTVEIGSIFHESELSHGSAYDMLVALGEKHRVFKCGAWKKAKMTDSEEIDFGIPYGKHRCYPFEFLELVKLPVRELGVSNLGFYAAGFNPVVDLLVMVWLLTGLYRLDVGLRLGTKIAMWAGKFAKPPFCTVIRLNATAQSGSRLRIRLGHEDAYVATAIPLSACMIQMLESDLFSQTGLHLMGYFLKAERFLADVESMGMEVKIEPRASMNSLRVPGGRQRFAV